MNRDDDVKLAQDLKLAELNRKTTEQGWTKVAKSLDSIAHEIWCGFFVAAFIVALAIFLSAILLRSSHP